MKKIAVLFPGIGYNCDKPLLYYTGKMLRGMGYEILSVPYTGFPEGVKGDRLKMQQSAHMALDQAEEMLEHIDWSAYDDILFVGKSVGTVVCAAYAKRSGLRTRQILFTPVEGTFQFAEEGSIAFHGTGDPWAETALGMRAPSDPAIRNRRCQSFPGDRRYPPGHSRTSEGHDSRPEFCFPVCFPYHPAGGNGACH